MTTLVVYKKILSGGCWFERLKDGLSWNDLSFGRSKSVLRKYDSPSPYQIMAKFPDLIRVVEDVTSRRIIGTWFNLYENGDHYTPWHQDKYGVDCAIVSFGGERTFLLKPKNGGGKSESYLMEDGDVMIFPEAINLTHVHSVPKSSTLKSPRISILFFLGDA